MSSNQLGEHVGLSHQWHSAPASRQLSISYIIMFSSLKEAIQARSQYGYKRLEEKEEYEKKEEESKDEDKKKGGYTEMYSKK
jgi:hypothetical protein